MTYPVDQIRRETAYIAYHFHWAAHDIHALEHRERLDYVNDIARLNTAVNGGTPA
ncbi:DUF6760 family protein [Streptomyces lavendulae]|uniref:DUF6760 family protein n=1 Tax=Streptomyces lavendulae TaxID=1914 RepID=UPI0033CC251C